MIMKVCDHCKGDGFWRRLTKDVRPEQNCANATVIFADGGRYPAMYAPISERPASYEFPCVKCSQTGEINWTRGKSLTPTKRSVPY